MMAPTALAASSTLYQPPASSVPRWCAYSGICAWKALPTRNDVVPPSAIIVSNRGSERATPRSRRTSASSKRVAPSRAGGRAGGPCTASAASRA